MTTLADILILSGSDNSRPILEKDMYDSWKNRMELYMMNRQHGQMILESVKHGPLVWPTIEENGVTRLRKYSKLTHAEAIQADCDVKETNIIFQGLQPEERECKLYDEFDKFAYKKGETLLAETSTDDVGTSIGPITIEEKAKKKNDVKARSMLLMVLPNEHLMTFNQYKDAKTLFAAIETRFDLDKISLNDLYNNFKIVEQEISGTTSSNTSNMAFVSSHSPNSTNEVLTIFGVSTASPQVSTANLSVATVYAFLANQLNGSQLMHEDLEQIHEDDLKEMDLKWQLALLKCFNYHKMVHFARECRVPRNQENKTRNQETIRWTVNAEDISSKAMVAIDGVSFDWVYMANDEAPINMAFMALSDSEVYTDNTCKTHMKYTINLKFLQV
nr:hypothetical protein [Tanacetum cinerariifolium]